MRRVTRQEALEIRRRMGLGDTDQYSENEVFRATQGAPMIQQSDGSFVPGPDPFYNPISFNTIVFATSNTSGNNGSVTALSQNQRRKMLLIQNQSSGSDLFVNFGADAGLNIGLLLSAGNGIFFDVVTPNNAIYVYFDSATNQPGVVIEGAPQL